MTTQHYEIIQRFDKQTSFRKQQSHGAKQLPALDKEYFRVLSFRKSKESMKNNLPAKLNLLNLRKHYENKHINLPQGSEGKSISKEHGQTLPVSKYKKQSASISFPELDKLKCIMSRIIRGEKCKTDIQRAQPMRCLHSLPQTISVVKKKETRRGEQPHLRVATINLSDNGQKMQKVAKRKSMIVQSLKRREKIKITRNKFPEMEIDISPFGFTKTGWKDF